MTVYELLKENANEQWVDEGEVNMVEVVIPKGKDRVTHRIQVFEDIPSKIQHLEKENNFLRQQIQLLQEGLTGEEIDYLSK